MRRDLEHTCQKPFLTSALNAGYRADGRSSTESRELSIQFHHLQRGHVHVSLGFTKVLCRLTGEVVKPLEHRPYDGFLHFNVDFCPIFLEMSDTSRSLSSPTFVKSQEIAALLETILRRSRALDTEGLYIEAGSRVWSLTLDIHVLNDDGNVVDAAALSALGALLHFRRDKRLEYQDTSVRAEGMPSSPLSIHHLPVLVSLCFMSHCEHPFVVDPTRQEECLSNGQMTIAINQFEELCGIHKSGGEPLGHESLRYAIRIAASRASLLIDTLLKALKSHEEERQERRKNIWNRYDTTKFPIINVQNVHHDTNLIPSMSWMSQFEEYNSQPQLSMTNTFHPNSKLKTQTPPPDINLDETCAASQVFTQSNFEPIKHDEHRSHGVNPKSDLCRDSSSDDGHVLDSCLVKDEEEEERDTPSVPDKPLMPLQNDVHPTPVKSVFSDSLTEDFSEAVVLKSRKSRTKKRKTKPI